MPIITSLLDNDFYKFTMSRFLSENPEGDLEAIYTFKNRSPNKISKVVSKYAIEKEFKNLLNLSLTFSDMQYLYQVGLPGHYLDMLSTQHKPGCVAIRIFNGNGEHHITIQGPWWLATLYETPCLAILNELYGRKIQETINVNNEEEILKNLDGCIDRLSNYGVNPNPNIIEFGTRRRFSKDTQERVIYTLNKELGSYLLGTSNVLFSQKFGLKPMGTMAHELPMGFVALKEDTEKYIEEANLISRWLKVYPDTYWLTDTFGTKDFLARVEASLDKGIGLRQDSGDPIDWITDVYFSYNDSEKLPKIMFSDGLDVEKIRKIQDIALEREWTNDKISFGWGTNLTNNGIIKPLSTVIKLTTINGRHTCKLSDNIKKASGYNNVIEDYKKIFNYNDNESTDEECRY